MEAFKKLTKLKEHLQDLSYEEAYELTKLMLDGNLSPIKSSAFLTAMRIKGETHQELTGIISAFKEKIINPPPKSHALDLALNYDGKSKTLYILPSAIVIANACGLKLTYHWADRVPAKEGTTLAQVMKALGSSLEHKAFLYISQKDFAPELYRLLPLRRELGFRTFINAVEKLLNPFSTRRVITSLFHKPYFEKLSNLCEELGFEEYTLVKGLEGGIEPLTDRPTYIKIKGKEVHKIEPSQLGMELPRRVETNRVLEDSVELNRRVLSGKEKGGFLNWAIYTASILLIAGGRAEGIKEALKLAREGYKKLL